MPLQAAPTEVQGSDCPKHCAKITRRDFNAQSCSQVYVRCAVAQTVAPSTGTSDTDDHAAALEQCQLGVVPHTTPVRRMDRRTIESVTFARGVSDVMGRPEQDAQPRTRHHNLRGLTATGLRKHDEN